MTGKSSESITLIVRFKTDAFLDSVNFDPAKWIEQDQALTAPPDIENEFVSRQTHHETTVAEFILSKLCCTCVGVDVPIVV